MEITKTITSIFIVPTLDIPKNSLKDNGFINGYIKDKNKTDIDYSNVVFILFKPKDLDKFKEFLDSEYERTKSVIEDYDYDGGYVVVIYKLNIFYTDDYNIVKTGKYSKTSKLFQGKFPRTVTIKTNGEDIEELSLQYRVFNKTEDLVKFWETKFGVTWKNEWEVWDGFHEEKETLDIKTIKI